MFARRWNCPPFTNSNSSKCSQPEWRISVVIYWHSLVISDFTTKRNRKEDKSTHFASHSIQSVQVIHYGIFLIVTSLISFSFYIQISWKIMWSIKILHEKSWNFFRTNNNNYTDWQYIRKKIVCLRRFVTKKIVG